jgi:hypothetical protein
MNDLRLKIKLEGKDADERDVLGDVDGLSIVTDDDPQQGAPGPFGGRGS